MGDTVKDSLHLITTELSKLTATTSQNSVVLQSLSSLPIEVKRMSKQMDNLADGLGSIMEICARAGLKFGNQADPANANVYQHFDTKERRRSITFSSFWSVCEYMGLDYIESHLAFIGLVQQLDSNMLKSLYLAFIDKAMACVVNQLKEGNAKERCVRALTEMKDILDRSENFEILWPEVNRATRPLVMHKQGCKFLKYCLPVLMEGAHLLMWKSDLTSWSEEGMPGNIKNAFFLMLLAFKASGIVVESLEIDLQGECLRTTSNRQVEFVVSMGEVKLSVQLLEKARFQLTTVRKVMQSVLESLTQQVGMEHKLLVFVKLIIIGKTDEEYKVSRLNYVVGERGLVEKEVIIYLPNVMF